MKKNLEEIERLLRITTNIDKLYKKLLELEIDSKKNTIEYSNKQLLTTHNHYEQKATNKFRSLYHDLGSNSPGRCHREVHQKPRL